MSATESRPTSDAPRFPRDRVVPIAGASRGIGAATAKLLGQHGAAVGVNYHASEEAAGEVVRSIVDGGGRAIAVRADARDPRQVGEMVRQVTDTFGAIDTLVLNAPGLTLTDATARLPREYKDASAGAIPPRRNGPPEDSAGAIRLLASDEAKYITGAYLPVSGGARML